MFKKKRLCYKIIVIIPATDSYISARFDLACNINIKQNQKKTARSDNPCEFT